MPPVTKRAGSSSQSPAEPDRKRAKLDLAEDSSSDSEREKTIVTREKTRKSKTAWTADETSVVVYVLRHGPNGFEYSKKEKWSIIPDLLNSAKRTRKAYQKKAAEIKPKLAIAGEALPLIQAMQRWMKSKPKELQMLKAAIDVFEPIVEITWLNDVSTAPSETEKTSVILDSDSDDEIPLLGPQLAKKIEPEPSDLFTEAILRDYGDMTPTPKKFDLDALIPLGSLEKPAVVKPAVRKPDGDKPLKTPVEVLGAQLLVFSKLRTGVAQAERAMAGEIALPEHILVAPKFHIGGTCGWNAWPQDEQPTRRQALIDMHEEASKAYIDLMVAAIKAEYETGFKKIEATIQANIRAAPDSSEFAMKGQAEARRLADLEIGNKRPATAMLESNMGSSGSESASYSGGSRGNRGTRGNRANGGGHPYRGRNSRGARQQRGGRY